MHVLNETDVRALLTIPNLLEALREIFTAPVMVPSRQIYAHPDGDDRLLAIMPALASGGFCTIKLAQVVPGNSAAGLPPIQACVVAFDPLTGMPAAMIAANSLTQLRTAATSALASSFLSRADSAEMVLIGAGNIAADMALAHASVRPLRRIGVRGRTRDAAERVCETIGHARPDLQLWCVEDTATAVKEADIVCCATNSAVPVLEGAWLKPGAFVDLVGSFAPDRREADDAAIGRSRIFVDSRSGVLAEAGDILMPMAAGIVEESAICGDIADLVCGRVSGRVQADEITLFKSVGTAVADMAAARALLNGLGRDGI